MHSLRKKEKRTGSVHFLSVFLCTEMICNLYHVIQQQICWSQNDWLLGVHIYSLSLLINIIFIIINIIISNGYSSSINIVFLVH
jgi:hypothetical protein